MLSGIGPAAHLQQLGIPVRRDLPVGHGLQDHIGAYLGPFFIDKPRTLALERDLTPGAFVNCNLTLENYKSMTFVKF